MKSTFKISTQYMAVLLSLFVLAACNPETQIDYTFDEFDAISRTLNVSDDTGAEAIGTQNIEIDIAAAETQDIFNSTFDSLDQSSLYVVEEKTGNEVPEKIRVENGSLIIESLETDRNPFPYFDSIQLSKGDILTIKSRKRVHPGNDRFVGGLFLYQTDNPDKAPVAGAERLALCDVRYVNFTYDPGRFPVTKGFVVSKEHKYDDNDTYASFEPIYDEWFDESVSYDSASGIVTYKINDNEYQIQSNKLEKEYVRFFLSSYGWHTGHKVEVDSLIVQLDSAGKSEIQIPEGMTPGAAVSGGFSVDQGIDLEHPDRYSLHAPADAADSNVPAYIVPLEAGTDDIISAADFSIGDVHQFDNLIRLRLPIPQGSGPVEAFSFNEESGLWQPEAFRMTDTGIEIVTDHLSTYAARSAAYKKLKQFDELPESADDAKEQAWDAFTEYLGFTTTGTSFASLLKDHKVLGNVDGLLGDFSNALTYLSIARKIYDGKTAEANIDSAKAFHSWAIGKWGNRTMKLAAIGTFFIDYSLTAMAENTFEAQWKTFLNAYQGYYRENGWSTGTWYKKILEILRIDGSAEDYRDDINTLIEEYLQLIWNDEGAMLARIADERGHGFMGDAGLEEAREKLKKWHMELILPQVRQAVVKAQHTLEDEALKAKWEAEWKIKSFLNSSVNIWVSVYEKPKDWSGSVIVKRGDQSPYRGKEISGRADFHISVPMAEYLAGAPFTEVVLLTKEKEGYSIAGSQKITITGRVTDVSFTIGKEQEEDPEDEEDENENGDEDDIEDSSENDKALKPGQYVSSEYSAFSLALPGNLEKVWYPKNLDVSWQSITEQSGVPGKSLGDFSLYVDFVQYLDPDRNVIAQAYFNTENGHIRTASIIPDKGKGKSIKMDGNGKMLSEIYYLDGEMHGAWREYFGDGSIKSETYYKNGVHHGPSVTYQSPGLIESEMDYVDGQVVGHRSYDENGSLSSYSGADGKWYNADGTPW